jgi:phosphate:Na+ symporter
MQNFEILIAALSAIILFLFGLDSFSKEIERISGERFRKFITTFTSKPIFGLFFGTIITAIIQSSSATTVITAGLVNAGIIPFKNSLGIIFGANIGTTLTAQLIALKLTAIAPLFIIGGFLFSLTKNKWSFIGKSIFYFGLVFFSLNLISSAVAPLKDNTEIIKYLLTPHGFIFNLVIGTLFTILVQSSSVTTGIVIIFTLQNLISLHNAIPILIGSNIGTTITTIIASLALDQSAKKTALAHFLFNIGGVFIFSPLLMLSPDIVNVLGNSPALILANVHFLFNISSGLLFTIYVDRFARVINFFYKNEEIEHYDPKLPEISTVEDLPQSVSNLESAMWDLLNFLKDNYGLVTLSIESNYQHVYKQVIKRSSQFEYSKKEIYRYCSQASSLSQDKLQIDQILHKIDQFDYLFQMHDSMENMLKIKEHLMERMIELNSDILMGVKEISSAMYSCLNHLHNHKGDSGQLREDLVLLDRAIESNYKELLVIISRVERDDVGLFAHYLTISKRLRDKLKNFIQLL